MKKVIATSLAFAVLLGLSACGARSDEKIQKPSKPVVQTGTETETKIETEVIPFNNVYYEMSGIYPEEFYIDFDASDSPLGSISTFTYFIESADDQKIIIRSRANIDDKKVQSYLEENNLKVVISENTYEINVADLKRNLLSADDINEADIQKMESDMMKFLETEHGKAEEDDSQELTFTLEKLYLVVPKEVDYELKTQKVESRITRSEDDTSFEDKEIIKNKASLEISSSNTGMCHSHGVQYIGHGGFGIFKGSNGMYYCVNVGAFSFINGQINEFEYKLLASELISLSQWSYEFDTESDAYNEFIKQHDINEDEFQVIDISTN